MALQKFAKAITEDEIIKIYNACNHQRDFTYIDDIVEGIIRVLDTPAFPNLEWSARTPDPATSNAPWRIYNIGNNRPVNLMEVIVMLEKAFGREARKEFLALQPGDVPDTWANIDDFVLQFDYEPKISVDSGINNFAAWYKTYHAIEKS